MQGPEFKPQNQPPSTAKKKKKKKTEEDMQVTKKHM
jgi:hypothetical protein